ncbi:inositol-tetrakisphosphate 1-kinase-like protein [Dinothrombium tinctorium]|uniref:Inositol-tetrakisphosphate 1-kinase n=1 Tax=Dinothrombium tinctorium TaxID=1965070 RepID=A0A443R350_9ACAR|nr:inositol-tetrakisphosphate 1-kinase-like protein [Dinothrombium tinctorium]RWS09701.1 inositol-tetrakisphosphate 1-kinase-like protein [Dinothrombium tinctorium]
MESKDADCALKVAYWWSDKKNLKMNADEFSEHLREYGIQLFKLNLDESLSKQGPFEAIIHKLSDVMVKADAGDDYAKKIVYDFDNYCKANPEMILIDPLDKVRILMDRYKQYKVIDESALGPEIGVFTPTFVELTSKDKQENIKKLKEADVRYPFVCKPLVAHGSTLAHQMSLIFCEKGLDDINPPCVAQTFINHNARLFKLFVIKDVYYLIERPSLKNFKAGDYPTIHFLSHDISKPKCCNSLTELDPDDRVNLDLTEPGTRTMDKIVEVLNEKLGLALYGIDVIIENETGRYAIIDMNAFPGYDGVDNILQLLSDMIVEAINARNSILHRKLLSRDPKRLDEGKQKDVIIVANDLSVDRFQSDIESDVKKSSENHDIDSGIETSDSCDEKKNKTIPIKLTRRQHSKNSAVSAT